MEKIINELDYIILNLISYLTQKALNKEESYLV